MSYRRTGSIIAPGDDEKKAARKASLDEPSARNSNQKQKGNHMSNHIHLRCQQREAYINIYSICMLRESRPFPNA